jgi:tRNA A37 methylthiotransferase MiaB
MDVAFNNVDATFFKLKDGKQMIIVNFNAGNYSLIKSFADAIIIDYLRSKSIMAHALEHSNIKINQVIEILRVETNVNYFIFDTNVDNISFVLKIAKELKTQNNFIIFKGYYAAIHKERLLNDYTFIDIIINGFHFNCYAKIYNNIKWETIPNICFRKNNKYYETINSDDWDEARYISPILDGLYSMHDVVNYGFNFSFGCPNRCAFCYSRIYYGRSFDRDSVAIIKELEYINSNINNQKKVMIKISDNDILKHADIRDILNKTMSLNAILLSVQFRFDQIREPLLKYINSSIIKYVSFGLETVDFNILLSQNKTNDPKTYLRLIEKRVKHFKKNGKVAGSNIILNLPNETEKSIINTILFIRRMKITDIVINYYVNIFDYKTLENNNPENIVDYSYYNKLFNKYNLKYILGVSEYYSKLSDQLFEIIATSKLETIGDIFLHYVDLQCGKSDCMAYKYCGQGNKNIVIGNKTKHIKIFSNRFNFLIKEIIHIKNMRHINILSGKTLLINKAGINMCILLLLNAKKCQYKIVMKSGVISTNNNKRIWKYIKLWKMHFLWRINHE